LNDAEIIQTTGNIVKMTTMLRNRMRAAFSTISPGARGGVGAVVTALDRERVVVAIS
jgi:hypothetical protein